MQGKPNHQTLYNSERLLGSSSAGRAILNKKVNGFAEMVQWVESEPKPRTPAPPDADKWPQASRTNNCCLRNSNKSYLHVCRPISVY